MPKALETAVEDQAQHLALGLLPLAALALRGPFGATVPWNGLGW